VNVLHVWISVRNMPLPEDRFTVTNPGKHDTMQQPATGILTRWRSHWVLLSVACACIFARMEGNPDQETVNKSKIDSLNF
jgi:hypothetical protein